MNVMTPSGEKRKQGSVVDNICVTPVQIGLNKGMKMEKCEKEPIVKSKGRTDWIIIGLEDNKEMKKEDMTH